MQQLPSVQAPIIIACSVKSRSPPIHTQLEMRCRCILLLVPASSATLYDHFELKWMYNLLLRARPLCVSNHSMNKEDCWPIAWRRSCPRRLCDPFLTLDIFNKHASPCACPFLPFGFSLLAARMCKSRHHITRRVGVQHNAAILSSTMDRQKKGCLVAGGARAYSLCMGLPCL